MAAWPEFYFDSEFESASEYSTHTSAVKFHMLWDPITGSCQRSGPALCPVQSHAANQAERHASTQLPDQPSSLNETTQGQLRKIQHALEDPAVSNNFHDPGQLPMPRPSQGVNVPMPRSKLPIQLPMSRQSANLPMLRTNQLQVQLPNQLKSIWLSDQDPQRSNQLQDQLPRSRNASAQSQVAQLLTVDKSQPPFAYEVQPQSERQPPIAKSSKSRPLNSDEQSQPPVAKSGHQPAPDLQPDPDPVVIQQRSPSQLKCQHPAVQAPDLPPDPDPKKNNSSVPRACY